MCGNELTSFVGSRLDGWSYHPPFLNKHFEINWRIITSANLPTLKGIEILDLLSHSRVGCFPHLYQSPFIWRVELVSHSRSAVCLRDRENDACSPHGQTWAIRLFLGHWLTSFSLRSCWPGGTWRWNTWVNLEHWMALSQLQRRLQ